jgi:hypothetical protein
LGDIRATQLPTMIPTFEAVRRAGEIVQAIEQLQSELLSLIADGTASGRATRTAGARRGRPPGSGAGRGKRRMSPEARERIARAARARWVKYRAAKKAANGS